MESNTTPKKYYAIATVFLIIGLAGIIRLFDKADLPFDYDDLTSKSDYESIDKADIIQRIDGIDVNNDFQLELILEHKSIGDSVKLTLLYGGDSIKDVSVQLVLADGKFFIYVSLILGLSFWLSSIFVISRRPEEKSARMLFWIFLVYSVAIMTPSPICRDTGDVLGYILRISHVVSYLFGIILFIHFTFIFPREKFHNKKIALSLIYLPPAVISLFLSVSIIIALGNFLSEWVNTYVFLWRIVQIYLVFGIIFCVFNLFFSYRKLTLTTDKRKLEWIFWGISAGVTPFLVLFVIPHIMGFSSGLPEVIPLSFLIIVPVSFIVAVLKYQLFDIEFIIKRSIIYAVLSAFVLLLYFGLLWVIQIVSRGVLGEDNRIVSLIVVFLIALLFNPMRIKVKKFVDRTFYRVKYDISEAVSTFANELNKSHTLSELGGIVINEIKKLIPVSKIAIALADESGERLKILSQNNFDELSHNIAALRVKKIETGYNLPFAIANKVEPGIEINSSLDAVLKRWDINLAVSLVLESREIVGILILGNKLSDIRYSYTDIELLNIISTHTALAVKRLQLQEKLVLEGIEKTRLQELNDLKSFFVSRVSHDLKTPLTSIKMFAEIMQSKGRIGAAQKNEYLRIIEGESARLSRLIDNVLNFAKIEKGIKEYNLGKVKINGVVREVLNLVQYDMMINKFHLKVRYCKENCIFLADSDAVKEALLNIISNAVKYSADKKNIDIATFEQNGYACIKISDEGRGIPENSLKIIFEPFYRSKDAFLDRVKGTGLGLAIVKHIMEAHNGKIDVQSEVGRGSMFTLMFPHVSLFFGEGSGVRQL